MDYKNYNPRQAALTEARALLTDAAKAAVADGTLPAAELPDFIVEIPADVKNGDVASNIAMAGARAFHKAPRQIAEAITAKLTARAEFVPSVIDCIWDAEKGRLLVGSTSAKAVQPVLELFKTTFGMDVAPITPVGDMPKLFASILHGEGYPCEGYTLHPMGSASLSASEQAEEKSAVAVQNSLNAVAQALEEGMAIQKLHLVATSASEPDWQVDFTLDASLTVSGLRFPKTEKGTEDDATFLLNADICSRVADMIEELASA